MNHTQLIDAIAESTGVKREDCEKVIRAFEDILSEGFSEKRWKSRTFDLVVKMVNSIRSGKEAGSRPEEQTNDVNNL